MSSPKQHTFITHNFFFFFFCLGTDYLVLCSGSHKAAIKMLARLYSLLEVSDSKVSWIAVRIHFLAAVDFMEPCFFKINNEDRMPAASNPSLKTLY